MIVKVKDYIKKLIGIMFLIMLLSSCVEEYWPELEEVHDSSLVVDGKITNLPGPYTVRLSQAISFQDSIQTPKVGATVKIIDDEGKQEVLIETQPGVYQTSATEFQGIIGRSYKVKIVTSDGKEYTSGFEELKNPIGIEEVSFEEKSKIIDETLGNTIEGYQFQVSSNEVSEVRSYFYWELEETYEHHADYRIQWYYEGVKDYTSNGPLFVPAATPFHETLFDCWATDTIRDFFTFSTDQLTVSKADKIPLHFLEFANDKLKFGYSLLVKQFSITERAHLFLKGLQEQNSNQDEFYTSQPYQVRGNISGVTNPEEIALGYFMAAGVTESERIFTKRPDGSIIEDVDYAISCGNAVYNNAFLARLDNLINRSTPNSYPMYFTTILVPSGEGELVLIPTQAYVSYGCVDCRKKGGTKTKPSFWINP